MTQNIFIFIGCIGSAISIILSLLYIVTGIICKKQNRQIGQDMQTEDSLDVCKLVDIGASMDSRKVFVCQVKIQEEVL